jgi:hypothetical protein
MIQARGYVYNLQNNSTNGFNALNRKRLKL